MVFLMHVDIDAHTRAHRKITVLPLLMGWHITSHTQLEQNYLYPKVIGGIVIIATLFKNFAYSVNKIFGSRRVESRTSNHKKFELSKSILYSRDYVR